MVSPPPRAFGPSGPLGTLAGEVTVPPGVDPGAGGGQGWEPASSWESSGGGCTSRILNELDSCLTGLATSVTCTLLLSSSLPLSLYKTRRCDRILYSVLYKPTLLK